MVVTCNERGLGNSLSSGRGAQEVGLQLQLYDKKMMIHDKE